MEPDEYVLPAHYAGYLINGDRDGYEDDELEAIENWVKGKGWCVGTKEDYPFFQHGHALNRNQGADCFTFLFHNLS